MILTGTAAYDKLKALLTKKALLNDIKKMSPDAQTSCLEGFHATLNYWHPKLICYSWLGSLCRFVVIEIYFCYVTERCPIHFVINCTHF